ncbi:MAG: hypothetical protein IJ795_03260 [Bacteroidales bacterium]|nr:hypothetical protein [Bacteroidales bacterium]
MLGRRILRVKAFKVIYSYAVAGNMSLEEALKQFDASLEATRDLYLFLLASVPSLTRIARERLEAPKQKLHPTQEELNPNDKFVSNALSPLLDEDPDLQKILERKKFSWDQYDIVLKSILDSVGEQPYFKKYMDREERSLRDDCRLFGKIFEKDYSDSDALRELLEDKSIYWYDDLEYALICCINTFRDLAAGKRWRLPELYRSEEIKKTRPSAPLSSDRDFARKLVTTAFTSYEDTFRRVREAVPDWDSDRLFCTDLAIIALGVAEQKAFPDMPLDITMNEYLEIAKDFCTPKSRQFVNGLMDKLIKENLNK